MTIKIVVAQYTLAKPYFHKIVHKLHNKKNYIKLIICDQVDLKSGHKRKCLLNILQRYKLILKMNQYGKICGDSK